MEPARLKAQQRKVWEANAAACARWSSVVEPALLPVDDALFDLAEIVPGQWVLDVATGVGALALRAAERVGRTGRVVGIDLAPAMLDHAERRARQAGLLQSSFHALDAEALLDWPEQSYDAALCRFGLDLLPDLGRALRGVHRVLTPDAPFAAAVWGTAARVPFIVVAHDVVERVLGPCLPAPFALSERGLLEQALSSAGFDRIRGERVTVTLELESAMAYAALVRETTPLGPIVAAQPMEQVDAIWGAVARAADSYTDASGCVRFPCEVACVVGRRG